MLSFHTTKLSKYISCAILLLVIATVIGVVTHSGLALRNGLNVASYGDDIIRSRFSAPNTQIIGNRVGEVITRETLEGTRGHPVKGMQIITYDSRKGVLGSVLQHSLQDKLILTLPPGAMKNNVFRNTLARVLTAHGLTIEKYLDKLNILIVKSSRLVTPQMIIKLCRDLKRGNLMVNVYPDVLYTIASSPGREGPLVWDVSPENRVDLYGTNNPPLPSPAGKATDPYFSYQENYLKFINATNAWNITTGSRDVVVAVIDTGIAMHPDIYQNLWVNPGEIPNNGVDDDHDGYVDDYIGYDFADNDSNPWDTAGHGTMVAGVIAAIANNSIGIAGVAPHVRVMALKAAYDYSWWLSTDAILQAINYVIMMKERGVNIVAVSASWGAEWVGIPFYAVKEVEYPLYEAIKELGDHGILFICAAGNPGNVNLDDGLMTFTPAEYTVELNNMITVIANDFNANLTGFSAYGFKSTDISAPGEMIFSLYASSWGSGSSSLGYAWASGTSLATPQVSATAALLASYIEKAGLTFQNKMMAIKSAILLGAPPFHLASDGSLKLIRGLTKSGYLNTYYALLMLNATTPSMLLESPAPYTKETASSSFIVSRYYYDVLPVNVSIPFKVLVGPLRTSDADLVVEVYFNGTKIGELRDAGLWPDTQSGDGIFAGLVTIPVNKSSTDPVVTDELDFVLRNATSGTVLSTTTYVFKVLNQYSNYRVSKLNDFIWLDVEPDEPEILLSGWTQEARLLFYTNVYGHSQWLLGNYLNEASAPWLAYESSLLSFGDPIFIRWYSWRSEQTPAFINRPLTLYGVTTEIMPYALTSYKGDWYPGPPYATAYVFSNNMVVKKTLVGTEPATMLYMDLAIYNYTTGSTTHAYVETFILNNGTILMSYKAAPAVASAFIAINEYLATEYSLQPLANATGYVNNVTIKFEPITTGTYETATTIQAGYLTLNSNTKYIKFTYDFNNPVIVLGPPTYSGYDPIVPYVTYINRTGFNASVVEFNYEDGYHYANEKVGYLVTEAGVHQLSDGRTIEAGYATATTTAWTWIRFPQPFKQTPVVLASLASKTSSTTVTIRIKGVNTTGFWVLLQPQQSLVGSVNVSEKIAWIALEQGNTTLMRVGVAPSPSGTLPKTTISYTGYTTTPIVLATMQTFNGADPCILRLYSLSTTSATIMIQEDTSADAETWHVSENIGYVIISSG